MSNDKVEKANENKILAMIGTKYPGYHPLMAIADIAHTAKGYTSDGVEYEDQALALRCHQTIAKYCEAEIKSIEVRGHIDHNISTLRLIVDDSKAPALIEHDTDVSLLQPIEFGYPDSDD